jgi:hypothetical protein
VPASLEDDGVNFEGYKGGIDGSIFVEENKHLEDLIS